MNVLSFCPPYIPLRAVSKEMCDRTDLWDLLERQLMHRRILHPPSGRAWQLRLAAASGAVAKMKMLLRFGTNPNTPILQDDDVYCENARHHCFRALLVEHGCAVRWEDDFADGITLPPSKALFAACVCGRWDAVDVLVKAGADPEAAVAPFLLHFSISQLKKRFCILRLTSRQDLAAAHLAKEDRRRAKEDAKRAEEDRQRAKEDARRAEEDRRRAQEDKRREKENAKREKRHARMQAVVATEEELEPTRRHNAVLGTVDSPTGSELGMAESSPSKGPSRSRLDEQLAASSQSLPSSQYQGAEAGEAVLAEQHGGKEGDPNEVDEFMKAIRRSRADLPVLSNDGAVLYRLTRKARLPEVTSILLESPLLFHCRKRVTDAGCEICPSWSSGWYFLPCTEQQISELEQAGFEIQDHHILALRSDKEPIKEALSSLPRKKRPHVSAEHGTPEDFSAQCGGVGDSVEDMDEDTGPMIVEEDSFQTDSSLGFPTYDCASGSNDVQ